MKKGIYTLGNDVVLDQIIALLNSIEANSNNIPVCVIPYDDRIDQLTKAISQRENPNVTIFSDQEIINKWDSFSYSAWDTHPRTSKEGYHRFGTHRRYCGFDGDFDLFLYMDADTLLLRDPEYLFSYLSQYDFLVYDFQYKDLSHVYNLNSSKLQSVFSEAELNNIFCSGFYGSRKNLFSQNDLNKIIDYLSQGEWDILYPMAPDQTLINYMIMRSHRNFINLSLSQPKDQVTGCCVTSPHFKEENHLLYDKDELLTYIHYIGLSSTLFTRVCHGENLDFPYRNIFLHYRYLKNPDQRPTFTGHPKPLNPPTSFFDRAQRKLNQILQASNLRR
ncbi:MAG: Npun_R2821/Npun_R2822 family protein [Prochlorotrichaceae cyanobacterium]